MKFFNRIKSLFSKKGSVKEETMDFFGFELLYSEGTSIVERWRRSGSYEPETFDALKRLLNERKGQTILDIGANIGFISLFTLSIDPDAKIFAFEPGPHQNYLFGKTIGRNNLSERIVLSDLALSNANGHAYFSIHQSADASGDGFVDTKRAGKTRKIKVTTATLDQWWKDNGKPRIDIVKMDTEGSEYWILEGGREMIAHCRPKVLIEINEKNLRNYPFNSQDLFQLIRNYGYLIKNLSGTKMDLEDWKSIQKKEDTFLLEKQ